MYIKFSKFGIVWFQYGCKSFGVDFDTSVKDRREQWW